MEQNCEKLMNVPAERYVKLVTDRTVEKFMFRLFLREARIRNLCIVSPFIAAMSESRFSLKDLCGKVEKERIPTYVVTRKPILPYQQEAMEILMGSSWIELRYNAAIHAKVFVASADREADSFALFGSGNLTDRSVHSNIEIGMMVYNEGPGREILRELTYWAGVRLRTLKESRLIQPLRDGRR